MCSETASPRVSFSNDLLGPSQDQSPMDQIKGSRRDDKLIPDSSTHLHHPSPDFEFRFCEGDLVLESSSADELFSNGIILPFISRDVQRSDDAEPPPDVIPGSNSEPPPVSISGEAQPKKPETTTQKSFWGGFKRSASLNSEKKKGLIFHLPLLSRSNSTGSVPPNQKPKSGKQGIQKQSSSLSSSSSSRSYQFPQKPPLRKNSNNVHGVCYGNGNGNANGIRVSPVLNVSPNLLGFGSFLRTNNGKDKKTKK